MDLASNNSILTLALATARLIGMFVFSPVFGETVLPAKLRAMIALVLALGLWGMIAQPAALPQTGLAMILALSGELLIGLAIGYAARLIFVGVELGAFHISQQMGLSLGEVFNPMTDETSEAVRDLFRILALVIFLAVGGHRLLLGALADSFANVPIMGFLNPQVMIASLAGLLGSVFLLAIKVAAPVLAAMLLAGLAIGFIQRTIPQINILSTGMPVRVMLGLVLIVSVLAVGIMPNLIGWASDELGRQLRTLTGGLR